jgi:hypothetical protein
VKKKLVTIALCSAVLSVLAAGCKQGLGERCQVDADCAEGLICSRAEPQTCGDGTGEGLDADLPPSDAPSSDAAPDAPPDAV